MAHTTDGFWTFGTEPVERPVKPPFRIRLTAANGERIVDSVPDLGKHTILISKHMNYLSMCRPINLKNRPLSCIDIFAICFNFLMYHLFVSGNYLYYLGFHFYFSQRSCNAR